MKDNKFSFKNPNYCPLPPLKKRSFFGIKWFQRVVVGSFLFSSTFLIVGKILLKRKSRSLASQSENLSKNSSLQKLSLPPVLVNFKNKDGIRMAQVSAQIETRYPSIKKRFSKDHKKFNKHLLLVLSGKEIHEVTKNKSYFEKKLRSQMNVFLPHGNVEKVILHTKMLN